QCCLSDMDGLILANHLCNNLGIDTISTGTAIAFAMECYERGLIPHDILEGQKLLWGDKETILKLIQDIAYKRTELGQLLASGVKKMAEILGTGVTDFAPHVKGVEFAAHDPRSCQSWGLSYVTGSSGPRHTEAPVWPEFCQIPVAKLGLSEPLDCKVVEGKPQAVKLVQDFMASAMNSCGCCYFVYGMTDSVDYVMNYMEAVTGRKIILDELLRCGERSFNLKRLFNARVGIGKKDDVLPKRFTRDALKAGVAKGLVARADEMLEEYYQLRGWDTTTGWPTKQKLEDLSLLEESKALYG
ncbi:aldehyde ferredoxin oxidoreductase C-terminal domain-containing protein, partial [Chloroflexota bacterium]